MLEYDFSLEMARFCLTEPDIFLFTGIFRNDNPDHRVLHVYVNGQEEIPVEFTVREGPEVRRRYLHYHMNVSQEITGRINLQDYITSIRMLKVTNSSDEGEKEVCSFSGEQLRKLKKTLDGYQEMERIEDGNIILTGWAAADLPVQVGVYVHGKPVACNVVWGYRKDVAVYFQELGKEYQAGYEIILPDCGYRRLEVCLTAGVKQKKIKISVANIRMGKKGYTPAGVLAKAWGYYKRNGLAKTIHKIQAKLGKREGISEYKEFLEKYAAKPEDLEKQRRSEFVYSVCFSVVVPVYKTKTRFLTELLESIQAQTYKNWELCLADGSGPAENLQEFIQPWLEQDARIKYRLLDDNLGIAGNTNEALKMATGDYVVLADHDDLLSPDALYECVKAINENREIDVLYSDEDKVDMSGRNFFEPHFKSDFNIDLLRSMNYICHLFVVRRTVLDQVKGFERSYDGAQDHDFILRCVEVAKKVYHIPKVLYHWRCHRNSTSVNPASKAYAFENGRKAVQAHLDRCNIPAIAEKGDFFGSFRIRYHWQEQPLVSIIIPNKDHTEDLKKCIESIEGRSIYPYYEFIIIENNSVENRTFSYYRELQQRENVTILYYEGEFNYSAINNYGVAHAKGEYLLLLNNDTEMIYEDGIREMLDICMRDDVGIVGARLLYEDNTIQHGGVIIGFGGIAGHAFIGQDRDEYGYFSRLVCVQDLSAVTAACLMTRRNIYEQVHGLSEEFRVAFNDIDYCMKVRDLGKLVVYNPYAVFYHYESKSRGLEDSAEKVERFNREIELFQTRWPDILENGDPYYNPNLTLDKADFSLKE